MTKSIKRWLSAPLVMALVLGFQNCGEVAVNEMPQQLGFQKFDISASACSEAKLLPSESSKFIFVIDMSRSNIGEFKQRNAGGPWYFETSQATDLNGARFDKLIDFINSCGGNIGSQFSVIGFSNQAGRLKTVGTNNVLSCDAPYFKNSTGAVADLNSLKALQASEIPNWSPRFAYPNQYRKAEELPGVLSATDYEAALNCVNDILVADVVDQTNATQNYQVFFISDGEPAVNDPAKGRDYFMRVIADKIQFAVNASLAHSKKINIHALYYTRNGANGLQIADYMRAISMNGGTEFPIDLGNISDTGRDNPFCKLLSSENAISFKPDLISSVNMSLKSRQGVLERDSDLDGLSDPEELELGSGVFSWNSIIPGARDSVCRFVGTSRCQERALQIAQCQTAPTLPANDCRISNQENCSHDAIFRLNSCEIEILGLNTFTLISESSTKGVDSDMDGMLDIVELYKGTDIFLNDMNLDPDADGEPNRSEIMLGRDPSAKDPSSFKEAQFQLAYATSAQGNCSSGTWTLGIDHIPGVMKENNLLLFYFRSDPLNSNRENIKYHQAVLGVRYDITDDYRQYVIAPKTRLLPIDFVEIGGVLK